MDTASSSLHNPSTAAADAAAVVSATHGSPSLEYGVTHRIVAGIPGILLALQTELHHSLSSSTRSRPSGVTAAAAGQGDGSPGLAPFLFRMTTTDLTLLRERLFSLVVAFLTAQEILVE